MEPSTTMTTMHPDVKKPKTLKEQLADLTHKHNELVSFLKRKFGDLEFDDVEQISSSPIKRKPRNNPGIYKDNDKRKYYISQNGIYVYKRPCGKPRKDKEWCYMLGEWTDFESAKTEKEVIEMKNDESDEDGYDGNCVKEDVISDEETDEIDQEDVISDDEQDEVYQEDVISDDEQDEVGQDEIGYDGQDKIDRENNIGDDEKDEIYSDESDESDDDEIDAID